MKSISVLCFLTSLCYFYTGASQNDTINIDLKGVIYSTTSNEVSNVYIINSTKNIFTYTDNKGAFSIRVSENDTLQFRNLIFKEKNIIVDAEIISKNDLTISLEEATNELQEVVLSKHQLSGDLERDIHEIPLEKNYTQALGFKIIDQPKEEEIVSLAKTLNYGLITNIKIEPLLNHMNGYYKRLKSKQSFNRETTHIEDILAFYGNSFFQDKFHLEKNEVYPFLDFCIHTDPNVIVKFKQEAYYETILLIEACAVLFDKK